MKITKRQLRKIIREMHPRAAADDAYVADLEKKEDELATQIRHASKDIHGRKDVYDLEGKSVEELEDILYDLANSPEQQEMDDMGRDEIEDRMGRDQELSRAEMAPRRQGMGRRPAGIKSQRRMEGTMRISKRELKRIIKEELEDVKRKINEQQPGAPGAPEETDMSSATEAELKNWFNEKRNTIKDLGIPTNQIRSLINAMEDAIQAAQSGDLKSKSRSLGRYMDKISGN